MVFGAINEKGEKYYTDLVRVFEAINNKQMDYNWLITDCVCYPQNPETAKKLDQEYCWISGDELTDLVFEENFQWVWGVLSAFDKSVFSTLWRNLRACHCRALALFCSAGTKRSLTLSETIFISVKNSKNI